MTASAALEGGPVARTERTFPCLDGVRALAATAVVGTHASFYTGSNTDDLAGRALARLDVGVPIFFVLSGFLLSRPLFLASAQRRRAPRTAAYLWRRGLRILPAYWLTVTVALLLLPANRNAGPVEWLLHLTLLQNYGTEPLSAGLSHTWSLSTEVTFYLLLPLIAAGLVRLAGPRPDRPTRILLALGAATLLGFGWLGWVWTGRPLSVAMDLWLPSFAGWFAAGIVLAVLSASDTTWRPVRIAQELGSSLPTCWLASAVLFWVATGPIAGPVALLAPTPAEAITKNALYLGVATFLVLPLVFGDQSQGLLRRVLGGPLASALGEVSYGLFLVHLPLLAAGYALLGMAPFTGNLLLVFLATWLVSVAVATGLYLGLEGPVRRWRGLVSNHREPVERPGTNSDPATATTAPSAST